MAPRLTASPGVGSDSTLPRSASTPMSDDTTSDLIARNDLDGLLRYIDVLVEAKGWDRLVGLRDACRTASQTGRQLWPASIHAEHRLALHAPASISAPIVDDTSGRFAIGPLTEVLASVHTWEEIAPHMRPGPVRALVAYERVLRGEDLRRDRSIDTSVFDLPLRLQPWETAYPLPTYEAWRGIFPTPPRTELTPVELPEDAGARQVADPTATMALLDLVLPWTTESNGRADAISVQGDALDAIAALGVGSARLARITPDHALATLAWTAASGGAHGRRRGMAAGRFNAWWAVASLAGVIEDWPIPAEEFGEIVSDLAWYAWDTDEPPVGWSFRIAVVDAAEGLAWAAMANDQRLD